MVASYRVHRYVRAPVLRFTGGHPAVPIEAVPHRQADCRLPVLHPLPLTRLLPLATLLGHIARRGESIGLALPRGATGFPSATYTHYIPRAASRDFLGHLRNKARRVRHLRKYAMIRVLLVGLAHTDRRRTSIGHGASSTVI